MRNKVIKEFLPLGVENLSLHDRPIQANRRGTPQRFRATSICLSDIEDTFDYFKITIEVLYEFGDRKDRFIISGMSFAGLDTELNVEIAPSKDLDHKNGKCKYQIINEGTSLVLELLY
jgi:hypothetical protein